MNIQALAKQLDQKYIKDIDSAAGKVGPYYFIVESTNQNNLIRVTFNVLDSNQVLSEMAEAMSVHRAIGRDGVRASGIQLFLECKMGGFDDAEEFAIIIEKIGTILHNHDIKQVNSKGEISESLGVFRVGTKLEIQTAEDVDEISQNAKERYKHTNQSRGAAFLHAFGWFIIFCPVYYLVRLYEPSFLGFVIFSFMLLIWMLKKSLQVFLSKWSPTKLDLLGLFLMYVLSIYIVDVLFLYSPLIFAVIKSGQGDKVLSILVPLLSTTGPLLRSAIITLAFASAFNYHIVSSLLDISNNRQTPVKRSIQRIL